MVKKNYFDSNMIQKENATLMQHFRKNCFAADVDRSKCLHATSPNAHFCTHYVGDLIFHKFSHSDVSYSFNGKNVNVVLELIIVRVVTQYMEAFIVLLMHFLFEPRHEKTCLRESPTRPDTNRPAQPQKLASLEISAIESRDIILSKQRTTKALIRLRGCAGWSAPLLFAYDIRHIFSWPGSFIFSLATAKKTVAIIN